MTGWTARSQNRWPSLAFDLLSINQLFSPIFVAGFYYKTFMWPAAFWEKLYEPLIRRAAGLGRFEPACPTPTITTEELRILRSCSSSAPARPAWRRRWSPAEPGCGSSWSTRIRCPVGACSANAI
jgi:NADPH-dependent 2,4-dienoyl-CoA reductase/sulfur reductase-like enzyme